MLIGLSLSLCVIDIMKGLVQEEEVGKIIAGTAADTPEAWEKVLQDYSKIYWRKSPEQGEAIARRLIEAGKIEQPRITQFRCPSIANRILWVQDESEIVWGDERGIIIEQF